MSSTSLWAPNPVNVPPQAVQPACFIQPHGALIVLDAQGVVTHRSRNAPDLLHGMGPWGQRLPEPLWGCNGDLRRAVETVLANLNGAGSAVNDPPPTIELTLKGRRFDVSVQAWDRRVQIEFEQRAHDAGQPLCAAALVHASITRLKRGGTIDAILEEAVLTLRQLTGFDRVTAHRFEDDTSSEVLAEDTGGALEAFVGARVLAVDVPAYARQLYTANTLRLVADADHLQVPVDAMTSDARPLDLSTAVLRSAAPVHLAFLKQLGVVASMSLSIVIEGRLWGLIACHHASARGVPSAVRMFCDMLVQFVGSAILVVQEKTAVQRRSVAADLRARLVEVALHADDVLAQFKPACIELQREMGSHALLLMHRGKHVREGLTPPGAVQLAGWLESQPSPLVALNELSSLPFQVRSSLAPHCGLLALCFDRPRRGWIVLLRREHVATIGWNFPPEHSATSVALPRPNGAATVQRRSITGQALPWDDVDRALAHQLADELGRASTLRNSEMEDAYVQLMGMLGHDLRDPLQTMTMVGRLLSREDPTSLMGQRIASSTGRMQRLITQVLDMSRLRSGNGLGISPAMCDLAALLRAWVDEARFAYPSVTIELDCPATLPARVDADRIAQVLSNLVSNARHHGVIGEPIRVALDTQDATLRLTVSNVAPPISAGLVDVMFEPLKRSSCQTLRNPGGLGLGLYIAREVARGHGGNLRYTHDGTHVVFTMEIGWYAPAAG